MQYTTLKAKPIDGNRARAVKELNELNINAYQDGFNICYTLPQIEQNVDLYERMCGVERVTDDITSWPRIKSHMII